MCRAENASRLAAPLTTCVSTSWTSSCRQCRSARPVKSSSPGYVSAAGTSMIASARNERSLPIRTTRTNGCTVAGTMGAGCPRASSSFSAAAIPRSRSVASGSRSGKSKTPCCACLASAKTRSEEHTSELQSRSDLVCRLLLEKKKNAIHTVTSTLRSNHKFLPLGLKRGSKGVCYLTHIVEPELVEEDDPRGHCTRDHMVQRI